MCGYLSAVIRAVLITECLLSVRGDGATSEEKPEIKYALIGAGIGIFIIAGFIILKICIIRKHVHDNSTVSTMRRQSEPQTFALSHLSQSENVVPMACNVKGQAE
nr:transmembrane protein 273 [Mastacembelus armatus]